MQTYNKSIPGVSVNRLKNTLRTLPYLAVMGMIWGYLAAADTGVIIGVLTASVTSIIIGSAADKSSGRSETGNAQNSDKLSATIPDKIQLKSEWIIGGTMKYQKLHPKQAAIILAKAWNNLDASLLEPYIGKDIIFWSQQALTDMTGKQAVMAHLNEEMETLRRSPAERIFAELGETQPYPLASEAPEPCVVLAHGDRNHVRALALLRLECGKINSIGICSDAPHPSTARRTGIYPR